jgi:hypothetical protein
VAWFEAYSGFCLQGLKKTTQNFGQESQSVARNLNLEAFKNTHENKEKQMLGLCTELRRYVCEMGVKHIAV